MNEPNLAAPRTSLSGSCITMLVRSWTFISTEEATIGIIVGGMLAETAQGQTVVQRTGALVLKPSGLLHRNQFGPGGAIMLSIHNIDREIATNLWSWTHHSKIARQAITIVRELAAGDAFGAAEEGAWRLLAILSKHDAAAVAGTPPPWLTEIRDQVASADARPSVSKLARSVGLHPVYLTRLFNKHYGCSISAFFRAVRVQRAAGNLLRPSTTVAAIAARHGFSDQSHFCRVFRSELGVAPSAYRALISRFAS